MEKAVDSYRFIRGISRRMLRTWVSMETPRPIPWTPLAKPLKECKVLYHLHIDPRPAQQDLNCLFPLTRLLELEELGEIGASVERHYSIMGYILKPEQLLQETVPAIIRDLRADQADVVVLVPA